MSYDPTTRGVPLESDATLEGRGEAAPPPQAKREGPPAPAAVPPGAAGTWRVDLLARVPALKWLVSRRWFQFAVVFPNLVIFYLFLIAGAFGSPVGNRNIIIVFVWILWWFVLISLLVPLAWISA